MFSAIWKPPVQLERSFFLKYIYIYIYIFIFLISKDGSRKWPLSTFNKTSTNLSFSFLLCFYMILKSMPDFCYWIYPVDWLWINSFIFSLFVGFLINIFAYVLHIYSCSVWLGQKMMLTSGNLEEHFKCASSTNKQRVVDVFSGAAVAYLTANT